MRKRFATMAVAGAALLAALGAPPASGQLALTDFEVEFTNADGTTVTQAGSHPFAMTTRFDVEHEPQLSGAVKDLIVEQMKGFVGSATAIDRCSTVDFLARDCAANTVVGITAASILGPNNWFVRPVENVEPPPGVPARLGFEVEGVFVTIDVGVKHEPDYNIVANVINTPEPVQFFGSVFQIWGVPGDPGHDRFRGSLCGRDQIQGVPVDEFEFEPNASTCSADAPEVPFLTVPRSCEGGLETSFEANSWEDPATWITGGAPTPAFGGCETLGFMPTVSSRATTDSAETGTGLDFTIDFDQAGLTSPKQRAQSEIKETVVTLPQGVTVNPSIAEGLGVCTPADLQRETISAAPGAGCPESSKIGTVAVQTPLLPKAVPGSVFLAPQDDPATTARGAENPFDSLISFYIVLKDPEQGVLVKVPAEVVPDPKTGQLVTTVDNIPQLPFSHFEFHFREGQRPPLITPPTCGTHTTQVRFTPWANPDQPITETASFVVSRGVGGGPCPPGGVPPFSPGFEAGSMNNNAGSFSPFNMRLTRSDGEQNMTKFSAVLPPGLLGKLAGVGKCSDAQIAGARGKEGRQELASPSCPLSSQIGHTLGGAGVGTALTHVPGRLYLAGPHRGAPLSVVSITPAVAGPFDAGNVVVRVALDVNPITGVVTADGERSDPIPHILKGIPLKVRDIRVYVDRSAFTLNPTSCDESQVKATLFGSYLDLFNPADDVAVQLATRYQTASCRGLGFKPRLAFRLRGGVKRGDNPALRAVLRPRPGDANIEDTIVRLPRSAFLDQAHIRTICTRVQFAADRCPPGAIYGRVRAFTPLLDEPLEGPAYLRSSSNELPDLVFDLKGVVDIESSARIDSIKGSIRASFRGIPDAPLTKVVVNMQGGKKGLIVNSRNLCIAKSRANVRFQGHNGKRRKIRPLVRARCGKGRRAAKRSRHVR